MPNQKRNLLSLERFVEFVMGGRKTQPAPVRIDPTETWWAQYTRECQCESAHEYAASDAGSVICWKCGQHKTDPIHKDRNEDSI